MAKREIKLIALDFNQAIIEQNYAYNKSTPIDLLRNKDDNSLKNPLYDYSVMNNLINKLFNDNKLTLKDRCKIYSNNFF